MFDVLIVCKVFLGKFLMVKNVVIIVKFLFVFLIDFRSVLFWKKKKKKVSINVYWNVLGCLEKVDYFYKIWNMLLYNENRIIIEIFWVFVGERGSVVWCLRVGFGVGWFWCFGIGWCKVLWM